jgi:hypothetical protein
LTPAKFGGKSPQCCAFVLKAGRSSFVCSVPGWTFSVIQEFFSKKFQQFSLLPSALIVGPLTLSA